MKTNILVKIITAGLLLVALLLAITQCGSPEPVQETAVQTMGGEPLDKETQIELGIEADTPEDTIKTLIANARQQKEQNALIIAENEAIKRDNQALKNMEDTLFTRLKAYLSDQANAFRLESEAERDNARLELESILNRAREDRALSGPEPGRNASAGYALSAEPPDPDGTIWIPPLGSVQGSSNALPGIMGRLAPTSFTSLATGGTGGTVGDAAVNNTTVKRVEDDPIIPVYTIAKNSTLVGATAFTALVGRVPVGNNVIDPYNFKAIVGKDNLIANGQEVPELAYAIVSGSAVGDWTLGCVQGDVYSITFVFEDGRITTLPPPADISKGGTVSKNVKIGELSDQFGNPCVIGKKITNAGRYLASRIAATAAGAAAVAAAASETTSSFSNLGGLGAGGVTVVDGDKGKYVLNETLAGAAAETAQWIRDRQALEFDAIYVPPGAALAIHITEELKIDYDKNGRMTHHPDFTFGEAYRELD